MADVDEVDDAVEETSVEETGVARSEETIAFWTEVRIDPVEIALPRGVGYTLRAYRSSAEITMSEVDREEDDFAILDRTAADTAQVDDEDLDAEFETDLDADKVVADADRDDAEDGKAASDKATSEKATSDKATSDKAGAEDGDESTDSAPKDADAEADDEDADDEDAEAAEVEDEEVPVFLGHSGRLYLFRTQQALVDFVRSDAPHDLAQLDTWSKVRERISADDVAPDEADRYELDLIVENLRGGQELWDADLLIRAGEGARDLGYALQIQPVLSALAPGSPLDDLDEALRGAAGGGVSGFFARRRLKKIGAQQAALGWRTIIGKISAVVDWRE